jgi:hypothetical protein
MKPILLTALLFAASFVAIPVFACEMEAPFDMNDAQYADVIVIGSIENYELVPFKKYPNSKYARFDVRVDKVIKGRVSKTVPVSWNNSTFALPTFLQSGPFLIALDNPYLSNYTVYSNRDASNFTMVQRACSSAFMLNPTEEVVLLVRRILKGEKVDQSQLVGTLFPERKQTVFQPLKKHWEVAITAIFALILLGTAIFAVIQLRQRKRS